MKYTKLNIDDSAVPKIDPEKAAAAKAIDEKIAADAMKESDRSGSPFCFRRHQTHRRCHRRLQRPWK